VILPETLPLDLPEEISLDLLRHELWMRGELEFLLWEQQFPIWLKLQNLPIHVAEFVILCARQFGKSTLGVLYAISEAIKNRDCCILIMGPDIKQTVDIVAPKMRFLTRTAPAGLIVPMASSNKYHVYHDLDRRSQDYTEIVIGGFNENSSSQRGKTVHLILVEEIVDVPEQHFLESMRSDLGPAMLHSKRGRIIYFTTPPKYPNHPFLTETVVQAQLEDAMVVYTIDDNIALTPAQKAKAIKLSGGPESPETRREYYCEVKRDPLLVCVPDFERVLNMAIFQLPVQCYMSVTIDWGGVRDKTCAILHTYDYLNDIDLFWDERVFEPNTSTATIVEAVREMEKGHQIHARYVDAPPQLVTVDLLQIYNYQAVLPEKLDWRAALNTLNVRCQHRKLLIHPRCKFVLTSLESGILNKSRTDYDRNKALGHMDGVAAAKYAIRMQSKENPYTNPYAETQALLKNAAQVISESQYTPPPPIEQYEGVPVKGFGRFKAASG